MSTRSDSTKNRRATPGMKKEMGSLRFLASLIDNVISTRSQDELIRGINTKRNNRMVNP